MVKLVHCDLVVTGSNWGSSFSEKRGKLRQSICDSSGLVTKGRKVFHTGFDVWRANIKSRILQDFREPLLVGVSSELKNLFYERNANIDGPAEVAVSPSLSTELAFETARNSSEQRAIFQENADTNRPAEVAVSPSLSSELAFETACISSEQRAIFQENSDDESTPGSPVEVPNTPMTQGASVEKELSPIVTEDLLLDLINEENSGDESTPVSPVEVPNTPMTQVASVEKELSPIVMDDLMFDQINEENSSDQSTPVSPVEVPNTPMTQVASVEKELSPIVTEDLMLDQMNEENSDAESTPASPVEVPNTPMTQVASVEKELSPIVTEDLMLDQINEETVATYELLVCRAAASYLQKSFLNQKEQKDKESLSLGGVLEGETRKRSARLFYEILVLKTKGIVDVIQENPYDDILVQKTPQMERI
ncbi:sister chromatid cohesion 1 protein 3-like [Telopea speciosissima]|uniref:sister chromatid cohesion 1 protein 3-like n=1 Tax=Telopea speciosissima TaxID=54955 RepID=UPI001CC53D3F|nr:sister chromatid cohesion 1 protein 3-like [Telopea speciosissima]